MVQKIKSVLINRSETNEENYNNRKRKLRVALAIHLAKLGHKIKIWSFSKEEADLINNEKKCKFLPKVTLPEGITCYLDYKEAIEGSEIMPCYTF